MHPSDRLTNIPYPQRAQCLCGDVSPRLLSLAGHERHNVAMEMLVDIAIPVVVIMMMFIVRLELSLEGFRRLRG
jgi:hypothetical protein